MAQVQSMLRLAQSLRISTMKLFSLLERTLRPKRGGGPAGKNRVRGLSRVRGPSVSHDSVNSTNNCNKEQKSIKKVAQSEQIQYRLTFFNQAEQA